MTRRLALALVISAALGLPSAGPASARSPATAIGARACTLAPTAGTVVRLLGLRTYYLYVPPGLPGPQAPLLLSLHGALNPALYHAVDTGWREFAAAHGFIVAFPAAVLDTAWDGGQGSYDVAFLRQVVADVSATWCVDPHHVHVEGHSSGANMAYRLACDAGDTFASVGAYAGATPTAFGQPCSPSRPIGVSVFQGAADFVVPPAVGRQARDEWVARDGCVPTPLSVPVSEGELLRYTPCQAGVEVWWRLYPGQFHSWPKGARGQDILNRMWTFFQANPRP